MGRIRLRGEDPQDVLFHTWQHSESKWDFKIFKKKVDMDKILLKI
jgi:hypothetical protein